MRTSAPAKSQWNAASLVAVRYWISLIHLQSVLALGLAQRRHTKAAGYAAWRVPFDVVTGKRVYTNMLVRAIEVTTDKTSENVLNCTLTLREVIITQTKNVTVADKSDMRDGVGTSAVQNSGTKSTTPVNESVIKSTGWFDGLKGTSLGNTIGIQ